MKDSIQGMIFLETTVIESIFALVVVVIDLGFLLLYAFRQGSPGVKNDRKPAFILLLINAGILLWLGVLPAISQVLRKSISITESDRRIQNISACRRLAGRRLGNHLTQHMGGGQFLLFIGTGHNLDGDMEFSPKNAELNGFVSAVEGKCQIVERCKVSVHKAANISEGPPRLTSDLMERKISDYPELDCVVLFTPLPDDFAPGVADRLREKFGVALISMTATKSQYENGLVDVTIVDMAEEMGLPPVPCEEADAHSHSARFKILARADFGDQAEDTQNEYPP